jgi:AbrB family looped-hinge helix DNA binding protein
MDKRRSAWQSRPYRVRLASGGRIVIPAKVRQLLGIQEGEEEILARIRAETGLVLPRAYQFRGQEPEITRGRYRKTLLRGGNTHSWSENKPGPVQDSGRFQAR